MYSGERMSGAGGVTVEVTAGSRWSASCVCAHGAQGVTPTTRTADGSRPLLDEGAGVDGEGHAGDVAGLVAGEEEHRVADVDRLDSRHGERVERHEARGRTRAGGAA